MSRSTLLQVAGVELGTPFEPIRWRDAMILFALMPNAIKQKISFGFIRFLEKHEFQFNSKEL